MTKDKNGKIIIGKYTKTGKKKRKSGDTDSRNVPFDIIFSEDEVIEILQEQIEHSKANLNNKENLLFTKIDGSYINHAEITSAFKRICRNVRIKLDLEKGCHIHMTKHTSVTILLQSGMSIYAISKLVGTTPEVLQKTYAHILDTFVQKEIEKVKKNRDDYNLINNEKMGKIIPFKRFS